MHEQPMPPRRTQRRRRFFVSALLLAAALWILLPGAASAHAHLIQADPAPASVMRYAPTVASFLFDEPLNPTLTRVRLADAAGHVVHTAAGYLAPGHDDELWRLPLPRLSAGTYSVLWTSESATDGHVMSSFYTFRVAPMGGTDSLGAVAGVAAGNGAGASGNGDMLVQISADAGAVAAFAWLGQLGQALWLGALIVELAVLTPARRSALGAEAALARLSTRRVWRLGLGALLGAAASLIGQTLCLAVQGSNGDWAQALAPATLTGMFASQNGQLLAARLALLLVAGVVTARVPVPSFAPGGKILAWPEPPVQRPSRAVGIIAPSFAAPSWELVRGVMLVVASLYLVLAALSGHAANVTPLWLAAGVDWVHLFFTAAWIGGIAVLAFGILPYRHVLEPQERAPAVLPLLDRFGPVAYAAVAALALSGLYNAVSHIPSVAVATSSTYGHLLGLKSGLVGVMMLLSASHVRWVRPLIAHAHQRVDHARSLATVHEGLATIAGRLRVEAVVGAAVLLVTALMGQTLPTSAATRVPAMTGPAPRTSLTATAVRGDLRATLTVAPPAIGTATFTVRLWEQGVPVTANSGAVLLHLYPVSQKGMRASLDLTAHGTHFAAPGSLALPGAWRADVLVRTIKVDSYRTLPFTFMVGIGTHSAQPGSAIQGNTMSGM